MWKRWGIWALLLLAAGVLYLFENNAASMSLLVAAAAVPGLCMLPLLFAKRMDITLTLPERCDCGAPVVGSIGIPHRLRLPLSITAELDIQNTRTDEHQRLHFAISGKKNDFTIQSEHCGRAQITVSSLRLEDPFGLAHRTIRADQTASMRVLPRLFTPHVIVTETAFSQPDSDRFAPDKPGGDPSETFGIREYRPGDSIKTIHWKLSQKSTKPVVRELSLPVLQKVLLLLVSRPASPEAQHSMTTAVLSISAALLAQGVEHTLGWVLPNGAAPALYSIENDVQYAVAFDALLAAPVFPDAALSPESRASGGFAHVAVFSAASISGLTDLYNGSRVTLLLCGGAGEGLADDGVHLHWFDSEDPSKQLMELEL